MVNANKIPNKLINQKSPYLLQHAYNPVDWYSWNEEAFNKAQSEDKPIFLSIGYSTCHWCHVMERESFEDEEVAKLLNDSFISIKVDREERPDIDTIYMEVCQVMTGHGGWPLTIIMSPDRKPFFAATYLPKNSRGEMSGLMQILPRINELWQNNRATIIAAGENITDHISKDMESVIDSSAKLDEEAVHNCFEVFAQRFDSRYGGFGSPPKFPSAHNLYFLLRYHALTGNQTALIIVEKTLKAIYNGGIYDHIGFGLARYSTDRKWLVPHFEKMLYDNALMAIAFTEAYHLTKEEFYARVAREIFTYIRRDMTCKEGGFYSAEDADSEGEEGKFYVWSKGEIISILGEEDGEYFCKLYDITNKGNFEGQSIPNLIDKGIDEEERIKIEVLRDKLFNVRKQRVHPYKDDKILTSWNGLMIAALAYGAKVLDDKAYLDAAKSAVDFIMSNLKRDDGRLLARYRDGEALYPAYASDYAFLTWGLLELYRASYESMYLEMALELTDDLLEIFWDDDKGGLFLYGKDAEQLLTRPKESYDGAIPADNSVAALNFLRLFRLTGRIDLKEKALDILNLFASRLAEIPSGHTYMLLSYLYLHARGQDIVITGTRDTAKNMLELTNKKYMPFSEVVFKEESDTNLEKFIPFIKDIRVIDDKATAFICEQMACLAPTNSLEELDRLINTGFIG